MPKTGLEKNKEISSKKEREKIISSLISSKILDYKEKLETLPVQLISVDQAEKDRKEVNEVYSELDSTNNQLLDAKFYTQLLKMNRERDKNFLKEGTTRKERIVILAQLMLRVTTPILFLNHKRNIQLNTFQVLDDQNKIKTNAENDHNLNYKDPETWFTIPNELTGIEIQELRRKVIEKLENRIWDKEKFSKLELTDWEADILSQLTRDNEIQIVVDNKNNEVRIIKRKDNINGKKVISFLIEPENKLNQSRNN